MSRRGLGMIRTILLVSGALLVAGQAGAQPRAADSSTTTAAVPIVTAPTDVWLKRLVGGYRFDGSIYHEEIVDDPDRDEVDEVTGMTVQRHTPWHLNSWTQPIQGKGDCIGFGSGPGLECVVSVIWPEMWRSTGKAQLGGVSDMSPAIILAGVDLSTGGIRLLLADHKGLAHPGSTTLSGDAASTNPPCVNSPGVQRCKQTVTLTAKADAKILYLVISNDVYFMRNKTDRKMFLEKLDPSNPSSPTESATEWVDERLEVSFSLRREALAAPTPAAAPSASPMSPMSRRGGQGSR